jgi:glycosyltransferase involved in cell wall biosynthesis
MKERGVRILHVDTGTGWRGGQQQVFWLMEGARMLGLTQRLLAPAGSPLAARARQLGLEVTELASPSRSWRNVRTLRQIASQVDLVHAHDAHAHTLASAAHLLGSYNQPPVVVSRRVAFPVRSFSHPKYRIASRFIAVSEFVRLRLLQAEVPEESIRVIYDGVKVPPSRTSASARAEFRGKHGVEEDAFLLGTLTSLAPEKLLEEELDLLAELPPTVHFWLGHPSAEPDRSSAGMALLRSAQSRGLGERFRIVPVPEDASVFLDSLDLFVYLSRSEGLGSAILLAMAHRLPVVASNVGGIPEIVRHLETGILVGDELRKELPTAILLLEASPTLRRRYGLAGARLVLDRATSDKMAAQTVALYEELLAGSKPSRA